LAEGSGERFGSVDLHRDHDTAFSQRDKRENRTLLDTRDIAREYILANFQRGSRILTEFGGPHLPSRDFAICLEENGKIAANDRFKRSNLRPVGRVDEIGNVQDIVRAKFDAIIISDQYEQMLQDPSYSPQGIGAYEYLLANMKIVLDAKPEGGTVTGSRIRVLAPSG
jgi:hypothetical protein